MIVYNETFVVEGSAEQEWLQWIKANHITAALATGCFNGHQILQVLDSPNEGVTYCLQFFADDIAKYQQFKELHAQQLHVNHHQQFENRYVLFNSLMQAVS
jgi:hypothetical protein